MDFKQEKHRLNKNVIVRGIPWRVIPDEYGFG